jgi:hypothetical protein
VADIFLNSPPSPTGGHAVAAMGETRSARMVDADAVREQAVKEWSARAREAGEPSLYIYRLTTS